jgi:membrane fusion protein (multidrug efflux system)
MLRHVVAWLVVVVAVAGISGGLGLYKHNELRAAQAAAEASPEPVEAVAVVRARKGEWSASTRAIGTVVALRQLEIRNELAGTIAEMGFASGDVVEAGQLLVQLDVRQERASLAAAEAEARLAKVTLERREGLRDSPAFSAQELDKSREEFAAATARAKSLEVAIEKKRIAAPFRARIGITNLQPGAYLDVGTLIGRLQGVAPDAFVDFSLPQDSAAAIRPGVTVTLSGPGVPDNSAPAKIVAVDDSVDGSSRAVRFRAVASGLGDTLRPGTFVDVLAVISKPRETVLVPLTAIRRSPNGQHVFVIAEEAGKMRARQRPVQTGPVQDEEIAIEKGLAAGEVIAASGSFKLRDGLLVQTDPPRAENGPGVEVN